MISLSEPEVSDFFLSGISTSPLQTPSAGIRKITIGF